LSAFVVAVASGIALASGRGLKPLLLTGLVIGIVAYLVAARRHRDDEGGQSKLRHPVRPRALHALVGRERPAACGIIAGDGVPA
jgi:hypothetical protein